MEKIFEKILFNSRFIVLTAIICGIIGAILLFIIASVDIFNTFAYIFNSYFMGTHPIKFHERVVSVIIGAVDLYLIAIVLLIFSFGIYELFISKIDYLDKDENNVFVIKSLDQLKDKILKVIIMVLVVSFFQKMLYTPLDTSYEMMQFAISIASLSIGLYFLGKIGKAEK